MLPLLTETFGNPSSPHGVGRRARAGAGRGARAVAASLGASPREIVFTSGGTEAINLALKGAAWAAKTYGNQLITTAVEHHATLNAAAPPGEVRLRGRGCCPWTATGASIPTSSAAAITDRTILVSLILANNEVGTLQPVAEIARRVRHHRRVLSTSMPCRRPPTLAIDLGELDVDLLSIGRATSSRAPRAAARSTCGAVRPCSPRVHGGTQERYRRAGTENVAGAVGLATALRLAVAERAETARRLRRLRERLREALVAVPGVESTGHPQERLPGLLSIVVQRHAEGGALQVALDLEGLACSTGSACTTGSTSRATC